MSLFNNVDITDNLFLLQKFVICFSTFSFSNAELVTRLYSSEINVIAPPTTLKHCFVVYTYLLVVNLILPKYFQQKYNAFVYDDFVALCLYCAKTQRTNNKYYQKFVLNLPDHISRVSIAAKIVPNLP